MSDSKKKWLACSKADQAPTFNQKRSRCVTAKEPAINCQEAIQETLSPPSPHHCLLLVSAATRLSLLVCTLNQALWAELRHLLIARLESLHSLRVSCLPHGCFFCQRLDSGNPGANNIVAPNTFPPSLMHCTARTHSVKPVIGLHRDAYSSFHLLLD